MVLYDYRLIEGSPLQYSCYNYYQPATFYNHNMESNDNAPTLHSPSSSHSDSENSLSGGETLNKKIKSEVICGWKLCGLSFSTLDKLATHVSNVHAACGPEGLFYCGWEGCSRNNKGFNARYKMLVHVRTHTNEKPHHCFQCDKSFSRAENLKIHIRSHSGEKPYVCPVPGCLKAYSNSSDRFKHTRTHQVDKPYQCKVPGCPKRYTDPSSLRKHVKTYRHFVNQNNEEKQCDCKHTCNVTNCLTKTELLKLSPLINLKENNWINPFINQEENVFASYNKKTSMDIDVPLDLSISRKRQF